MPISTDTWVMEAALLKKMQPVVEKIIDFWTKKEKNDVDTDHCAVLYGTLYPDAAAKAALLDKIDKLIAPSTRVLANVPTEKDDEIVLKLSQFRFDPKMSQKGMSRMPDIWERLRQMFPLGFKSADERLQPFFAEPGGTPVRHQSVGVKIGMAKVCSCYMIVIAAIDSVIKLGVKKSKF